MDAAAFTEKKIAETGLGDGIALDYIRSERAVESKAATANV